MFEFDAKRQLLGRCVVAASKTSQSPRIGDPRGNKKAIPRRRDQMSSARRVRRTSIAEIAAGRTAEGERLLLLQEQGDDLSDDRRDLIANGTGARISRRPRARRCARAYIRAKLDFSRRHTAQSQMSPTRPSMGALPDPPDRPYAAITVEKARVSRAG